MVKRVRQTAVVEATTSERVDALFQSHGLERGEGTVLLALIGDELVGAAVLRLHRPDAELVALVTDPNHRHRGVGRELVLEMRRRARAAGCRRLRVRLSSQRDAALSFFVALGFEQTHLALDLAV